MSIVGGNGVNNSWDDDNYLPIECKIKRSSCKTTWIYTSIVNPNNESFFIGFSRARSHHAEIWMYKKL
jgi:hypothetical protein